MRSITRKLWSIITQAQMLVIFLAFALMVVLSYLYVSDVQRKHLWTLAQDTIAHTEVNIKSDLLEPETFLGGIAETIRVMILQGKTLDEVWDYLNNITEYVTTNEQFAYATGVYGFFDVFGGKFCNSIGWIPPDDYVPQSRPWYIAAEEADGKVGTTEPYLLVSLQTVAITFARRIFDDDGNPLGVVCLDIRLDRIRQYAVETQFAEKGYGFLLSRDFTVIAHPNPSMVGIVLADQKSGIADFANELKQTGFISERISTDYRGIKSIVYIGRLYNGWYMGIVTPRDTYYKTTRNLMVMLSALGTVLAVILSLILLRIISAKIKADTMAAEVVELEKRKAEIAEESNKTKSDFLARVSHEIRTPLNAILGIAEIQLHDDKLADNARDAFGRVSNSGSLLLAIINDILDLSKIEAGKMELLPAKYEVASLIHDTAQLNLIRYESKPIIFSLHIGENIPTMLVGDELRIKQILNNILSNAFKYTEKGEVKLSVSAEPMGGEDESDIMILIFSVTDTGQGMTAEQIERLGDSYSRFNMEANRLTVGTGLGMTIAKTLILLMDGQISIKSEPGKGSTFTVRLPQWTTGSSQTISRELADNLSKFRINSLSQLNKSEMKREFMPYGRVLIVDDVETNLYVARGLMAPYGLSIDTATSGIDAVQKIKDNCVYDIIFMDHMMPKMDGMEATKIIREMGYAHPIVALTANALVGQAEIFMQNGFDDFISKPIDTRDLNATLNRLIRDKQPQEVIDAAREQEKKLNITKDDKQTSITPQLADIFIRDAKKALAVLETAYNNRLQNNDDISMYVINVHAMKSALANISEQSLSDEARKLEHEARERNIEYLLSETQGFLRALHEVIIKITPKETEGGAVDESKEDVRKFLLEKFTAIQTAAGALDKKTIKKEMSSLTEKVWSPPTKKVIDSIAEHLLHSDFEEIEKEAGKFLQK